MKSQIKAIASGNVVAIIHDGKAHTITTQHPAFDRIKQAVQKKRFGRVLDLLDIRASMPKITKGHISIQGDEVFWKTEKINGKLADRILAMLKEKKSVAPLTAFLEKLQANTTPHVKVDLFNFLEHRGIPLTPSGNFLAYKNITANWKDHNSGTFDNRIGMIVKVERQEVNHNRDECASYGLHVGALGYVSTFNSSGKVVVVEVNPADVVAVPTDYNAQKLRVCRYKVLKLHKTEEPLADTSQERPATRRAPAAPTLSPGRKASKMSTPQAARFLLKSGCRSLEGSKLEDIVTGDVLLDKEGREKLIAMVKAKL